MNKYRQKSFLAFLTFFVVIGGMILAYFTLPPLVVATLLAFALVAGLTALGMGFNYAGEARNLAQMQRGEGILARWTLDPARWQAFEQSSKSLAAEKPWMKVDQVFTGPIPDAGIEVVFMDDCVFVGGEHRSLDKVLSPVATLHTSWIEFELSTTEETEVIILRVPFAPEAQSDAEGVIKRFNTPRGR